MVPKKKNGGYFWAGMVGKMMTSLRKMLGEKWFPPDDTLSGVWTHTFRHAVGLRLRYFLSSRNCNLQQHMAICNLHKANYKSIKPMLSITRHHKCGTHGTNSPHRRNETIAWLICHIIDIQSGEIYFWYCGQQKLRLFTSKKKLRLSSITKSS